MAEKFSLKEGMPPTLMHLSMAYCSLRNEMERNEMKRNEMERNEMKICSLRNENL